MVRYCQHCQQYVEVAVDAFSKTEICSICGLSMPDLHLATGTIVSGFQIVDEIGRGGMGVVYKAKQLNLERYVALKILSDELAMDLDFVDRFFSEARAAASLSHPNIVQAFDAGATAEGIYYLAMELIEGETLDRRISREGRLEVNAALGIAEKITDALNHAWERQKLCHGDIKPDNIILNSSGGAKLADLGLAKSLHEDVEHHQHELMVTPFYAPPELINRDVPHINVQSDMYSFGATLYHMLSGAPPFRHQDMDEILRMHVQETPEPLVKKNPEIKKPLSNLIDKLLSKNPEDRLDSWEELEDEIESVQKGGQRKKKKKTTQKNQVARHPATKTGSTPHRSKTPTTPHPGHISTPAPQEKIAPVEIAPKKSSLVPLISFLLGLLFVLCVLVAFALHWKKNSSASFDKTAIAQEWRDLKTDLEFLPPEKALDRSRKFAKKYKGFLPADVNERIKLLERKHNDENNKKKQAKTFEKELQKLAAELRSADFSGMNLKKLLEYRRRIENIRGKVQRNVSFSKFYPASKKDLLDEKYSEINSILNRRKKVEMAKRRKKEHERRKAARKKAIERRKARERERQQKLKIHAVTNLYYTILADLMRTSAIKNSPVHVSVVFNEWLERNKDSVSKKSVCYDRAEFIAKAFSGTLPVENVFVERKEDLLGGALPLEDPELQSYKVDDIDDKGIKLALQEGKVKFGKKLRWSRMESEDMIKMLRFLIEKGDLSSLSPKQKQSILAYLILNNQSKNLEDFMAEMNGVSNAEREKWRIISEDFRISIQENRAIKLWRQALESVKNKDYKGASEHLMELSIDHKETLFFERYKNEIDRLLARFKQMSPEAQALYMTAEFDKAIEAGAPPERILNLSMTAYIRYGSLKGIDAKLKQTLEDSRREALSIIIKNTGVASVSENRLPFFKWESEPVGEGYAFARFVGKSRLFKREDPIMKFLVLGASLDVGNWKLAGEILSELEDCSLLLRDIGPLKEWAPSLLFGYCMAVERFGDSKRQKEALNSAMELADSFDYGKLRTLAQNLALEYAMKLREYDKALSRAERHDYAKSRSIEDFRIALLNLLAMLQKPDMKTSDFKDKLAEFRNIFKDKEGLEGDFLCCDVALAILEGQKSLNGKSLDAVLDKTKPYAKDICARIVADAFAKMIYSSREFTRDSKNINRIEKALWHQLSDNPVSSSLWSRLALLKLASSDSPANMERKARALLLDSRICALQMYPALLAFNAGVSSLNDPGRVEYFRDTLGNFLEDCPVASTVEQNSPKILYPGISSGEFAELKEKCSPESSYLLNIFGLMANNSKPSIKSSILKDLDEMSPSLRWQEKLLLRKLKKSIAR